MKKKAMGLLVLTEAKWLVRNGNSIRNNYDFWLNVRSNVSRGWLVILLTKQPHNEIVH